MIKTLVEKIKYYFRDKDPLDPVDFKIKLETDNSTENLVIIQFHNDDKTPMEFVVKVIEAYFPIGRDEAVMLMLEVHTKGIGKIKWLEKESAELALKQIEYEAQKRNYPLKCSIANA